ncbi:MAG TPA: hypothetical protein VMB03_13235 [Bryobacteraceae bacterium]|nr:hypothetical protein [Bryobacteraceae bacterium]
MAACLVILAARPSFAQNRCVFYLANNLSTSVGPFVAQTGVGLSLEAQADSNGTCPLSGVSLNLTVGDGPMAHTLNVTQAWQTGAAYTVQAIITPAGPQELFLNGTYVGTVEGSWQPGQTVLRGSQIADAGTCRTGSKACEAYLLTQISLNASNGANGVDIAPDGANPAPLPMILMSWTPPPPQGAPWQTAFPANSTETTTITASFRFDVPAQPKHFDPYIDPFGQPVFSGWPGKVQTASDLTATIPVEQAWLANNAPLTKYGMDQYGGSTLAGWTDSNTGYFHTAWHNNRFWLISPEGNPLFYIGLDAVPNTISGATPAPGATYTPIEAQPPSGTGNGRLPMFPSLPPGTGDYAAAYGQDLNGESPTSSDATTYFSFAVSNWIQKYGENWQSAENTALYQRLGGWGFAGSGKWSSLKLPGLVVNPVLNYDASLDLIPNGHPDVWDESTQAQLHDDLESQIGKYAGSPWILGWSVGNERAEIVKPGEVKAILKLGPSVPAKVALVNWAFDTIYGGSISALAGAWGIQATTLAQIYAAQPVDIPATDVETLREYYEGAYYSILYSTVKTIDPNHLYLGSWIQPKIQVKRTPPAPDWPIAAANCDVIGIDYYNSSFSEADVETLIASTNKPVIIGEFSFPSNYGGVRGFGSKDSAGDYALSDSQAGEFYAQWLSDASSNPYVVGAEWFEYVDEAVTGRGNKDGIGNNAFSLVLGENYAFGMLDVTDTPKFDLVNRVRAANIGTLQSLGLLGKTPVLTIALTYESTPAAGPVIARYTIVVANAPNAGTTGGTISVKETFSSGLTLSSMTGAGWTCKAGTCTRSDALPGGSSYPPITVFANVAATAAFLVNQASVSGGGSPGEIASDSRSITGQ